MKLIIKKAKRVASIIKNYLIPSNSFRKVYTGNVFHRFHGLEILLEDCKGLSVLDIGSAEGLIDYEFARNGASIIHGFERDIKRVKFSKLLFQEVPVKSKFHVADLSVSYKKFDKQFKTTLLGNYDIVLYLGIYHHLIKQTSVKNVQDFIKYLLDKTNTFFVVRTNMISSFENIIIEEGFQIYCEAPLIDIVGQLKIYKRIKNKQ